jgi:hypothetical protein
VNRVLRGLLAAVAVAVGVLAAGPVGLASASVTMEESPGGTTTNNAAPTFGGTTTELTAPVTVRIYPGASATGTPRETLTTDAPLLSTSWSLTASPPLEDGTYTAIAEQEELLGPPSTSGPVTFTIITTRPTVTLSGPPSLSNKTKPSFSGEASDQTPVVVHIRNSGTGETETASATPGGGGWSTSGEAELGDGTYTAYATQASSFGNPEGESSTVEFAISTAPPTVTLSGPPSPSNKTKPSFSGEASDHTQVTVHIRNAASQEVASATATPAGGSWGAANEGELASGSYTAYATQQSSLGNEPGKSATVSFTIDTASPTVTLERPPTPSNDTTPSFSGFASDTTPVTVTVYSGASVVAEATANGTGGEWVSETAHPALPSGNYTAVATQTSSLGNPPGKSETVSFTVETGPPHVTLNQPPTPSNHTTPSFTGTASDHTPVIIDIYAGATAEDPVVSEATATGNGGAWSSGAAANTLTTGEYTAVARQESSLSGNPSGVSAPVSFFVDTRSPTVTIEQPAALSNKANPTFSGTASDTTKVVVHVVNAANAEVATVGTTPSGGHWSTNAEGTLASESYSAYATQESSLGNPQGESKHVAFTVDTRAPVVALNPGSVQLRSNNRTPSFTGTASDTTTVTVHVFEGSKPEGKEVAQATVAGGGGSFATPAVSPALAEGVHEYTAIASQESSLGNPTGKSNALTFTVDTASPTVTLTQPPTPSSNTLPSFTGSASETTPVSVHIYEGTKAEGKEVSSASASGTGGAWTSGPVTTALSGGTHTYTAVAEQTSAIQNSPGKSAPVTFVVDTTAPKVTLGAVATSPSNNVLPTFSGTATDKEPVTVDVYVLSKAERTLVATAKAEKPAGSWTSLPVGPALPPGDHEFAAVATQSSSIGNPPGTSNEVKFVVDTTSPALTISGPPSPGNNLAPAFSGTSTATHAAPGVTVRVYLDNGGVRGGEVSSAKTTVSSGKWTTGAIGPPLAKGTNTYLAVATQQSLLGNPPGTAEATFVVNTEPPAVTLIGPPASSNNRTPAFEGTASDTTPVTLRVYEGVSTKGKEVTSAVATPGVGGAWNVATTLPAVKHTYTAVAIEKSSITGNPEGRSGAVTFVVDPAAPSVTLTPPPTWTSNTSPTFAGSASDNSPVKIKIYPGPRPEGPVVAAEATATGTNGAWASGPASPALADGQYTAVATQENSVTHADPGSSGSVTFNVDTVAPHVTLTSPASGGASPSTAETVGGAAGTQEGDLPRVTAQLFAGSAIAAGQTPVQSLTVGTTGKSWSATFGGLSPGTYTARALQLDAAGNVGVSSTSTFTVTGPQAAAGPSSTPVASLTWFPRTPRVGEAVSLISSSTDTAAPLTGFAWDPAGTGAFSPGGSATSVTFRSPGNHRVQLRVNDANGQSSVASALIPVSSALPLMQPFPVVRIAGVGARFGIKLSQLSVQAAAGTQITVQCRGRRCPVKLQTVKVVSHVAKAGKPISPFVEFRRFERPLAAGLVLEIRVARAGVIGKYTRFVVRRGKLPSRFDACLVGTETKPVGCPSS